MSIRRNILQLFLVLENRNLQTSSSSHVTSTCNTSQFVVPALLPTPMSLGRLGLLAFGSSWQLGSCFLPGRVWTSSRIKTVRRITAQYVNPTYWRLLTAASFLANNNNNTNEACRASGISFGTLRVHGSVWSELYSTSALLSSPCLLAARPYHPSSCCA